MRRLLKFLHTMGSAGMIGGMAAVLALLIYLPPPTAAAEYSASHAAMGLIATWVLFPSLALTLVPGLLSFAVTRAFHEAGWALAKLATGILVFEGMLVSCIGPLQARANIGESLLAGKADIAELLADDRSAQFATWVLLFVSTANVVLGVWRPRFTGKPAG